MLPLVIVQTRYEPNLQIVFAFCGLISALFLSQTKRYRPEAAAEAD